MKQFGLVLWFLILYSKTTKSDVGWRKDNFCNISQEGVQKEDVHTTCRPMVNVCFVCVWVELLESKGIIWKNSRGARPTLMCANSGWVKSQAG